MSEKIQRNFIEKYVIFSWIFQQIISTKNPKEFTRKSDGNSQGILLENAQGIFSREFVEIRHGSWITNSSWNLWKFGSGVYGSSWKVSWKVFTGVFLEYVEVGSWNPRNLWKLVEARKVLLHVRAREVTRSQVREYD